MGPFQPSLLLQCVVRVFKWMVDNKLDIVFKDILKVVLSDGDFTLLDLDLQEVQDVKTGVALLKLISMKISYMISSIKY